MEGFPIACRLLDTWKIRLHKIAVTTSPFRLVQLDLSSQQNEGGFNQRVRVLDIEEGAGNQQAYPNNIPSRGLAPAARALGAAPV